ncbi:SixA phosphatase family protein [Terrihabitans sp. B22-R8]|uniref:SixA phosphatase family protein n=1 Tax=Terrihabitans sp. B22-R8 TaxID=3425128 RepID=UPI00403D2D58
MRRLVLFRHAKGEAPDPLNDYARKLAPRGQIAARGMGEWLAGQGIVPDLVICSGSARTRQTWSLAASAFDPAPELQFEDRIYEAEVETLLDVVREQDSEVYTLLLVGHNPGLELLTGLLAESGEPEVVDLFKAKFPTAAIAIIDFEDVPWAAIEEKTGWLSAFVTPKHLGIKGE